MNMLPPLRVGEIMVKDDAIPQVPDRFYRDLRGTNQTAMRAQNERIVLSLLHERGALPKAEIARLTGLSAQTVSVIMRALEKDGLLLRGDPVRGRVGQPSIPMDIAPDGAFFFGLKVGRRSADLILVDFRGNIQGRLHSTYRFPTPDQTLDFATQSVRTLTRTLPPEHRNRIAGLGIAIPGYLWEWAKTIGEPIENMTEWRERDIRAEIDALFDFPVYLQNDASCACGAELVFGTNDDPPNFLYFYIGYFIGGGIVINNTLFAGPTGNAGALGPLRVPDPNGPGQAQLIDVASLATLERQIRDKGGNGALLWESADQWPISSSVLNGWIARAADGLAHAIVAVNAVIDFELVVVDGWMPAAVRHELVEQCTRNLAAMDMVGLITPKLRTGTIGAEARSIGAASLPLSNRFLVS